MKVPFGERLDGGKVAEICENTGMRAICFGDENCGYSDSRFVLNESDFTSNMPIRCVVTQNNLGCGRVNSKSTLTQVQTPI